MQTLTFQKMIKEAETELAKLKETEHLLNAKRSKTLAKSSKGASSS